MSAILYCIEHPGCFFFSVAEIFRRYISAYNKWILFHITCFMLHILCNARYVINCCFAKRSLLNEQPISACLEVLLHPVAVLMSASPHDFLVHFLLAQKTNQKRVPEMPTSPRPCACYTSLIGATGQAEVLFGRLFFRTFFLRKKKVQEIL